jgi:Domain of unknown function (DUF4157)
LSYAPTFKDRQSSSSTTTKRTNSYYNNHLPVSKSRSNDNSQRQHDTSHFQTPISSIQDISKSIRSTSSIKKNNNINNNSLFQPKLRISQPGDVYEQEADRIAEKVMSMPSVPYSYSAIPLIGGKTASGKATDEKCTACESKGQQQEKIEIEISRKPSYSSNLQASDQVTNEINSVLSGSSSSPLDVSTKEFMETRFGGVYDLSNVRIHTDAVAAKSAESVNALAYTVGNDIVFGQGQYRPGTIEGKRLLAHELTHVAQQSGVEAVSTSQSDVKHTMYADAPHGGIASKLHVGRHADMKVIQRQPRSKDLKLRQRATALKAADARTLLRAALPFVLEKMTDKQIQQMQRVLDAAVVNPEVEKEVQALDRQYTVRFQGKIPVLSEEIDRIEPMKEKAWKSYTPITEVDKRIRLDFEALLTPEALQPTTDNPDEAAYLINNVRQTLAAAGVWLRFEPKRVRSSEDPSRWVLDERDFEVWLSLGPTGYKIPTQTGKLNREALLGNQFIGGNYYREVNEGPTETALDTESRRLLSVISTGLVEHELLAADRRKAFPGVAEVSDLLGGAEFPDLSIWDQPHQLVIRAMGLKTGGNVSGSKALLFLAAISAHNAAQLLAKYIENTTLGAGRAVGVLKVAKAAGEVAGVVLTVTGVVGLVRGSVAAFGGAGAAGARATTSGTVDTAAQQLVRQRAGSATVGSAERAGAGASSMPRPSGLTPQQAANWERSVAEAERRVAEAKVKYGGEGIVNMAISRQQALNRMQGLTPRIEEHLAKIAADPRSQAVSHWRTEIHAWLGEIERLIPHVGKKTGAEWRSIVAEWRRRLGE